MQVQAEDGWIAFFPGPVPMLTSGVDAWLNAPVIGTQWFTWHVQDLHFRCARARRAPCARGGGEACLLVCRMQQ
jgi:hypothetical protein